MYDLQQKQNHWFSNQSLQYQDQKKVAPEHPENQNYAERLAAESQRLFPLY